MSPETSGDGRVSLFRSVTIRSVVGARSYREHVYEPGGDAQWRWSTNDGRAHPCGRIRRLPSIANRRQDLAAEQSVLGGMLLSKDAIADVMESLSLNDFYKPAHSLVFDAIMDLYSRGEPADTITVAAELDKNGTLGRIGGAVYLHTLMATVPTAANAAFYAQIVAEKAILRRLVEAGTRIVQLGYGGSEGEAGGGEVDEIVDRAQAEIYDVTERRTTEDYVILEGAAAADDGRDRRHRPAGRQVGRRADRVRRSGQPDQRAAPRADDHRRRPARHR